MPNPEKHRKFEQIIGILILGDAVSKINTGCQAKIAKTIPAPGILVRCAQIPHELRLVILRNVLDVGLELEHDAVVHLEVRDADVDDLAVHILVKVALAKIRHALAVKVVDHTVLVRTLRVRSAEGRSRMLRCLQALLLRMLRGGFQSWRTGFRKLESRFCVLGLGSFKARIRACRK